MAVAVRPDVVTKLLAVGVCSAALLLAGSASAAVSVIAASGLPRPIDRIELAGTASARSTVIWCSVHTRRSARFAIIAELTPGASVEGGLDAWLKSLDLVSAPRVLPPETASTACGAIDGEPVLELLQRGRSVAPVQTVVVDPDGVEGLLSDWKLPAFGASDLGVSDAQATLFAALYETKDGGGVSQVLRVRFEDALPALPYVRTPGWDGIPVSSYLFAPGRAVPQSAAVSRSSALAVRYHAVSRTTDYAEAAERFLLPYADVAWLEEASIGPLDEWGPYAEDVIVPPLLDEYFRSAHSASEILIDPELCATGARVRLAGAAAEVEPACAAADDLELALAGMPLTQARVTRYQTLTASASPDRIELGLDSSEPRSPLIVASNLDGPDCGDVSNPPAMTVPGVPGGESEPVYMDPAQPEYYYESEPAEIYCGSSASSASSSDESCESDSSSEEDCQGDTSSSDDSYSGDSCSDDSSDDYSGDSCEGEDPPDDDSYSGDSCSDDSGASVRPTSTPSASIARSRPRRARLSVLTLVLCALLFGTRRAQRAWRVSRAL